jgi:hypothetical protein
MVEKSQNHLQGLNNQSGGLGAGIVPLLRGQIDKIRFFAYYLYR